MSKRKNTIEQSEHMAQLYAEAKKNGGLLNFLYDKKTGLVMGRNGKEWCQLIIFYLIFYACLFLFWSTCLYGFLSTTNLETPTLTGYQSMLKLNPAIGYRPQPDFESNLIKFNMTLPDTYKRYLADANSFLIPYFNQSMQQDLKDCDGTVKSNWTVACKYNPREQAPLCFTEQSGPASLNFPGGDPCIILKMNRIYGWLPNDPSKNVRVRCFGENDADSETIGTIQYYPGGEDERGTYGIIPGYYFPYLNQPGYLSPLVFAHFVNMKKYTVALIWCEFDMVDMRIGEDNSTYVVNRALNERAGGVHFELVVDQ